MLKIQEGAIVAGKSGKPLKVVSFDGEVEALISAIERVLAPSPDQIKAGDYLHRKHQLPDFGVIPRAIVEKLSTDGCWVRSNDGELLHVPITSIESGLWEFLEFGDGEAPGEKRQNLILPFRSKSIDLFDCNS